MKIIEPLLSWLLTIIMTNLRNHHHHHHPKKDVVVVEETSSLLLGVSPAEDTKMEQQQNKHHNNMRGMDDKILSKVRKNTKIDIDNGRGTVWNYSMDKDVVKEEETNVCNTLKSISSPKAKQVRICFRNSTNNTNIVLCWVSDHGTYHHYYTLHPFDNNNNNNSNSNSSSNNHSTSKKDRVQYTNNNNDNEEDNDNDEQQQHQRIRTTWGWSLRDYTSSNRSSDHGIKQQTKRINSSSSNNNDNDNNKNDHCCDNDNPMDADNNNNTNEATMITIQYDTDHIETSTEGHIFVILVVSNDIYRTKLQQEQPKYIQQFIHKQQQQQKKGSSSSSISSSSSTNHHNSIRIIGAYRANSVVMNNENDSDEDEIETECIHFVEIIDPLLINDNTQQRNVDGVVVLKRKHSIIASICSRSSCNSIMVPFCRLSFPFRTTRTYKKDDDNHMNEDIHDDDNNNNDPSSSSSAVVNEQPIAVATTTTTTMDIVNSPTTVTTTMNVYERYILRARMVQILNPEVYDTTKKKYQKKLLGNCRWPVMCEHKWYGNDPTLVELLANDIDCMATYLPPHAVTLLRDINPTPIWVNKTIKYGPKHCPIKGRGMCYHPHLDWLIQVGMNPKKCYGIELYMSSEYRTMRTLWGPGGILLHEMSHAYHDKGCYNGYNNTMIEICYNKAMDSGIYDSVPVHGEQGPVAEAYAKTNAMEYFAELSTAFLGGIVTQSSTINQSFNNDTKDTTSTTTPTTNEKQKHIRSRRRTKNNNNDKTTKYTFPPEEYNKWYPHNRQQIQEHDPDAYELLKTMWKL